MLVRKLARVPDHSVRSTVIAVVAVALLGLFAGCASSDVQPAEQSSEAVADGAELYAANCAVCHGADLRGTDKGPSHLSIVYEPSHHSDESFRSAIINGAPQHHWNFGKMAPIRGLSHGDIEAIIGYVRAEQQRLGVEQ